MLPIDNIIDIIVTLSLKFFVITLDAEKCFGELDKILTGISPWSTGLFSPSVPFPGSLEVPSGWLLLVVVTPFRLVSEPVHEQSNSCGLVVHIKGSWRIPEIWSDVPEEFLSRLDIAIVVIGMNVLGLLLLLPYEVGVRVLGHHHLWVFALMKRLDIKGLIVDLANSLTIGGMERQFGHFNRRTKWNNTHSLILKIYF